MIAMRYMVFFFDPSQNREYQLVAIQPIFHSPSAIKALLKTAKYEGKRAIVFSGMEDGIEQFIKVVQRKDTTDWLSMGAEELEKAMTEEAKKIGVTRFETDNLGEDEQVLGDPPLAGEDRIPVEGARKRKIDSYPADIPVKNHELWDSISFHFKKAVRRVGKDIDKQEAAKRILYQTAALKLGVLPFSHTTVQRQHDLRSEICNDIEAGNDKATTLVDTWERHLKSEGILKKTKAIKYLGSDFESKASRFYIAHTIEWELGAGIEWKNLCAYLTRNHALQVLSKDHLAMPINRLTKLEIIQDSQSGVSLYISHVLTPSQASTLTGKESGEEIVKILHKYSKEWYKTGSFPNIKQGIVAEMPTEETTPKVSTDMQPGSAHPDNWQTGIQTGKSQEDLRQDAKSLADIMQSWQGSVLQAEDLFESLTANSDKYLHLFEPILIKGLSRSKLEIISKICTKFANLAQIV